MAQAPIAATAKGHDDTSVWRGGGEETEGGGLGFQIGQSHVRGARSQKQRLEEWDRK